MYANGLAGLGEEPGFFDAGGTFESITKPVNPFQSTKIRCSSLGSLFTEPKSKADKDLTV